MGIFSVSAQVGNPFTSQAETIETSVDTGATDSVMPSSLLRRLGIEPVRPIRYRTVCGERVEYDVGRASFSGEGVSCFANVVFGPEGVDTLLGATTLEQLYLAVDPVGQQLVPVEGLLLQSATERMRGRVPLYLSATGPAEIPGPTTARSKLSWTLSQ